MFRFRCFGFLPFWLSAKTASFARNKLFWQQIFGQNVGRDKVFRPKEAVSALGLVSAAVFRPKNCFVCPLAPSHPPYHSFYLLRFWWVQHPGNRRWWQYEILTQLWHLITYSLTMSWNIECAITGMVKKAGHGLSEPCGCWGEFTQPRVNFFYRPYTYRVGQKSWS